MGWQELNVDAADTDDTGTGRPGQKEIGRLKEVIEQAWTSAAGRYEQMWRHGLRTDAERRAWLTLLESLFLSSRAAPSSTSAAAPASSACCWPSWVTSWLAST